MERATKDFGRLDVLINNAGIVSTDPDLEADLKSTLDTNAIGAAVTTYAFVPLLKKSKNPRVIHVSSGLGSIAGRTDPKNPYAAFNGLSYRMSKAAMNMLAAQNKHEFAPWGAKVWTMCPGYVVTNLTGEADRENRKNTGALSSETSAQFLHQIIRGERDADDGKFVHVGGVYPW